MDLDLEAHARASSNYRKHTAANPLQRALIADFTGVSSRRSVRCPRNPFSTPAVAKGLSPAWWQRRCQASRSPAAMSPAVRSPSRRQPCRGRDSWPATSRHCRFRMTRSTSSAASRCWSTFLGACRGGRCPSWRGWPGAPSSSACRTSRCSGSPTRRGARTSTCDRAAATPTTSSSGRGGPFGASRRPKRCTSETGRLVSLDDLRRRRCQALIGPGAPAVP